MKRLLLTILIGTIAFLGGAWLYNTSYFETAHSNQPPRLIAHRGVHQTFSLEGVENDTCTATRIDPPIHSYLENTLPSMQAAFTAGAQIVELDIHLTTDGQFAIIHDWTLDCRTDGTGVTHDADMATLKSLDIGYGYTADGGRTYPFRGKGVGEMPTLNEVFERFPEQKFLVNFKSNLTEEGNALAQLIAEHPEWRDQLWGVYGGTKPTDTSRLQIPELRGYTRESMIACAKDYMLLGWTGQIPTTCHNTVVLVPANYAWAVWGWPHKFTKRMESVCTDVILIGPFSDGDIGTTGIDNLELLAKVPAGFGGYVWTNRIELIGPDLGLETTPPPAPMPEPTPEPETAVAVETSEDSDTESSGDIAEPVASDGC